MQFLQHLQMHHRTCWSKHHNFYQNVDPNILITLLKAEHCTRRVWNGHGDIIFHQSQKQRSLFNSNPKSCTYGSNGKKPERAATPATGIVHCRGTTPLKIDKDEFYHEVKRRCKVNAYRKTNFQNKTEDIQLNSVCDIEKRIQFVYNRQWYIWAWNWGAGVQ